MAATSLSTTQAFEDDRSAQAHLVKDYMLAVLHHTDLAEYSQLSGYRTHLVRAVSELRVFDKQYICTPKSEASCRWMSATPAQLCRKALAAETAPLQRTANMRFGSSDLTLKQHMVW
jgi:hypothetical protein